MPSVRSGCAKSASSLFTNEARPPIAAMSPSGSCRTCQVYWKALPSVKSLAVLWSWPRRNGSKGVRQVPFECLPRMRPRDGSKTFFQKAARARKRASSPRPSRRQNSAAHQSSNPHSSVRLTLSPLILSNG